MENLEIWIKLALSDLKSSKILYRKKQFRNSYFLFQQASEKANKALSLFLGSAKEEDLKKANHNQFKILRSHLLSWLDQYKKALKESKGKSEDAQLKITEFKTRLSSIDKLLKMDVIKMPIRDLRKLYIELETFKIPIIERVPELKAYMKQYDAQNEIKFFARTFLKYCFNLFFIMAALFTCALLTNKHFATTRYPDEGGNPFDIYNHKSSLIKIQLQYMTLLEDAIGMLKKISKKDILT